jgi:hypothetical protein
LCNILGFERESKGVGICRRSAVMREKIVNIDERFSVYSPPGANIKHFENTNHDFVTTDLLVIARHFDPCVIFLKFSVKELSMENVRQVVA